MDLVAKMRWRRAFIISLLFHVIVLTGVGWMTAKIFVVPDIPEQYIELELASEFDNDGGAAEPGAPESVIPNASPSVAASMPEPEVPSTEEKQVAQVEVPDVSSVPAVAHNFGGNTGYGGSATGTAGGAGTGGGTGTGTSTKPGKGGGGLIPPGILSRVEPDYPEGARQAGQEGTVVLKIQILENGRPGQIIIHGSSGYDILDDAAVAAVRKWRFIPAKERESGQVVICYTTMPVVFKLKS